MSTGASGFLGEAAAGVLHFKFEPAAQTPAKTHGLNRLAPGRLSEPGNFTYLYAT